jgi:hypothetical protein
MKNCKNIKKIKWGVRDRTINTFINFYIKKIKMHFTHILHYALRHNNKYWLKSKCYYNNFTLPVLSNMLITQSQE